MLIKLAIFMYLSVSYSLGACPSDDYVYCSGEGGTCRIPDTIKEGFMSYGANDRFNLIPFTNSKTDGTDITIECDNDHGDIIPGTGKACCYIATSTGYPSDNWQGYVSEGDNGWTFTGEFGSMRYGADYRYVYRVMTRSFGWCNNGFFNDPVHGTNKYCNYNMDEPASLATATWSICANEGDLCSGLDATSTHWIRYGDYGAYYYRLVISGDGSVPCNNDLFDDPVPGDKKYCYRSNAQYTFSGATGRWDRVPSCYGCSSNEYTKEVGIEELTASEMTSSWERSLTASMSASYGFASADLSTTVSESVTNTVSSSITESTILSTKYVCNKNAVFQWNTGVTQNNGISTKSFTISSEEFLCMDDGYTAKCPPGYCADENCQQCTESINGDNKYNFYIEPESVSKGWYYFNSYIHQYSLTIFCLFALLLSCNIMYGIAIRRKGCCNGSKSGDIYNPVKLSDDEESNPINL